MGSYVPFVFPWASLAHLLALSFLDPFPNFVFSWAFTGFIRLWACYSPFLLFAHHTLPMGLLFAISLFLGSFEPICFLKAHLLISWTCDPLFLPFRLNGFCSLSFANFFSVYVTGLGFLLFIRVPRKDPQHLAP